MVHARIYRPGKTAMQSGRAKTRNWILEFNPVKASFVEPLMGWRGSRDTLHQVRLTFPSLRSALDYARTQDIETVIEKFHVPDLLPKRYSDNFRPDRVE